MGKLTGYRNILLYWALPILLALAVFASLLPYLARPAKAAGTYKTGADTVNGFQQVYIYDGTTKTYITSGKTNHTKPDIANNNYVTYVTENNADTTISLYNITTQVTTTLISTGTNLRPRVDSGKVVWQRWSGSAWQIYLYNGSASSAIGVATSAVRPDIEGDLITYATKNGSNQWEAYKYTISTSTNTLLSTGNGFAWPRLSGGSVIYGFLGY